MPRLLSRSRVRLDQRPSSEDLEGTLPGRDWTPCGHEIPLRSWRCARSWTEVWSTTTPSDCTTQCRHPRQMQFTATCTRHPIRVVAVATATLLIQRRFRRGIRDHAYLVHGILRWNQRADLPVRLRSEVPMTVQGGPTQVRSKIRRIHVLIGVGIAAFALLLPTLLLGWAPIFHWTCVQQDRVAQGTTFVPLVLVNSPFGGNATGVGVVPPSFPGGFGYPTDWSAEDTSAENGTASGTFNEVNVSIYQVKSTLVLGPGTNSRCSQTILVVPTPPPISGSFSGFPVAVPSNLTDRGEASTWSPTSCEGCGGLLPLYFNNSFSGTNEASISTCNTSAKSILLNPNSESLSVSIGFSWNGRNFTAPMTLPFIESYRYWFPADSGTWQVDNLSAPGGPGGGWAFSYSPCP